MSGSHIFQTSFSSYVGTRAQHNGGGAAASQREFSRVALNSWGCTLRGERDGENEDAFLNWPERQCWAVADGVGGSDHGGEASRLLIETLMGIPEAFSLDHHIRNIRSGLEEANHVLASHTRWPGSAASTIVVLLIHGDQAACLWSGDSRCYLLRDGILYQCTHDHTLRQEKIDSGELTVPEANRMIKGNIITNAIGGNAQIKIDEVRFTLKRGDRFLLCTDGLSNTLSGDMLSKLLGRGNAHECADSVRNALLNYTYSDSATFVVVFLPQEA